jgi:hypothetical protein
MVKREQKDLVEDNNFDDMPELVASEDEGDNEEKEVKRVYIEAELMSETDESDEEYARLPVPRGEAVGEEVPVVGTGPIAFQPIYYFDTETLYPFNPPRNE